jgi:hypothetical protein
MDFHLLQGRKDSYFYPQVYLQNQYFSTRAYEHALPNLKKVDKMKQQTKLDNGPNNTSMGIYIDL